MVPLARRGRTFRLDRIGDPVITRLPIEHRAADVTISDSLFDTSGEHMLVELEFSPEALGLLGEFVPEERGSSAEAT